MKRDEGFNKVNLSRKLMNESIQTSWTIQIGNQVNQVKEVEPVKQDNQVNRVKQFADSETVISWRCSWAISVNVIIVS